MKTIRRVPGWRRSASSAVPAQSRKMVTPVTSGPSAASSIASRSAVQNTIGMPGKSASRSRSAKRKAASPQGMTTSILRPAYFSFRSLARSSSAPVPVNQERSKYSVWKRTGTDERDCSVERIASSMVATTGTRRVSAYMARMVFSSAALAAVPAARKPAATPANARTLNPATEESLSESGRKISRGGVLEIEEDALIPESLAERRSPAPAPAPRIELGEPQFRAVIADARFGFAEHLQRRVLHVEDRAAIEDDDLRLRRRDEGRDEVQHVLRVPEEDPTLDPDHQQAGIRLVVRVLLGAAAEDVARALAHHLVDRGIGGLVGEGQDRDDHRDGDSLQGAEDEDAGERGDRPPQLRAPDGVDGAEFPQVEKLGGVEDDHRGERRFRHRRHDGREEDEGREGDEAHHEARELRPRARALQDQRLARAPARGHRAEQSAEQIRGPGGDELPVGRRPSLTRRGEGALARDRLGEAHQRDGQGGEPKRLEQRKSGQDEGRHTRRDGADRLHTQRGQSEEGARRHAERDGAERRGQPRHPPLQRNDRGERRDRDGQRRERGFAAGRAYDGEHVPEEADLVDVEAEELRHLVGDDYRTDAGLESGQDRLGDEVRHESEAEQRGGKEGEADEDREGRRGAGEDGGIGRRKHLGELRRREDADGGGRADAEDRRAAESRG